MRKRFIAILLTVILVISYLPGDIPFFGAIPVSAETSGDYSYDILSDGTVEITGYTGKATELKIPRTIDGKAVTSIGYRAFDSNTTIESLTIPDSVTSIDQQAFSYCFKLISITIPDSVESIGMNAFFSCTNLTDVTIPGNEDILNDWNIFSYCESLKSVTILDGVTTIGNSTFIGCKNLRSITIPDSVSVVEAGAFSKTAWYNNQPDGLIYAGKTAYQYKGTMPKDTRITLKDGTTCITGKAFENCSNLVDITIPHSVVVIGEFAFKSCNNLTSIINPDSVTHIRESAFQGCTNLISITIPESVTNFGYRPYENANGVLYCYADSDAATYGKSINNGMKVRYLIDKYHATLDATSYMYDGTEKTPKVTVDGLTKGTDFDVEYTNNTNPGTATVTITGKGNYAGTITKTFTIKGISISGMIATLSTTSYIYDGIAKTPKVIVENGDKTLTLGTDYTVSYANNINAGTATVTITGIGIYAETIKKTFTIKGISISGMIATLSTTSCTYDGKAKTPGVTVKTERKPLLLEQIIKYPMPIMQMQAQQQ